MTSPTPRHGWAPSGLRKHDDVTAWKFQKMMSSWAVASSWGACTCCCTQSCVSSMTIGCQRGKICSGTIMTWSTSRASMFCSLPGHTGSYAQLHRNCIGDLKHFEAMQTSGGAQNSKIKTRSWVFVAVREASWKVVEILGVFRCLGCKRHILFAFIEMSGSFRCSCAGKWTSKAYSCFQWCRFNSSLLEGHSRMRKSQWLVCLVNWEKQIQIFTHVLLFIRVNSVATDQQFLQ